MKAAGSFKLHALYAIVAVAMLAACGSQPQVGAGSLPGVPLAASSAYKALGSGDDLLYGSILTSAGDVAVYSYPEGVLQTTFSTPNDTISSGMCADANGDVFVTAYEAVSFCGEIRTAV